MENNTAVTNTENSTKRYFTKTAIVGFIALLLLIPLVMVSELIYSRENTKDEVTYEVGRTYALAQTIDYPEIESEVMEKSNGSTTVKEYAHTPAELNYVAKVDTEVRSRSIYDVIVYQAAVEVQGNFVVDSSMLAAQANTFKFDISDFKGLLSIPEVTIGDKTFAVQQQYEDSARCLGAKVTLPAGVKEGDVVDFTLKLNLKGTEELSFVAGGNVTTVEVSSSYPHPSFSGDYLPVSHDVRDDGFEAEWSVLDLNMSYSSSTMGVKFVEPASPYQQAERSVKYGILIVALVFVAGLLVEYRTRREINAVQYAVIGLSLVLFYALQLAFSEFVTFGIAYVVAAAMTIGALMFYFRAILKSRSGYMLGGFVAIVYAINYILLQMETYALLAGSLLLFVLLCVVMYITANVNNNQPQTK